jgi:tetratricopeptide (TPR) repeat protein
MMEPSLARVSVVVRSMARPSLGAALASLAAQQGARLEVLVIAACGPTHPPVAPNCGALDVRLIASGVPLRGAAAANAGLDAARGEWITFLDDDDRLRPGHVSGLLAAQRAEPRAGVVHSYADAVFADGHHERFGQPFSLLQLYERNFIHLSSTLIARASVADGCRFDETLEVHEDWDFFLQLAQRTRFAFAPVQTFEWHAEAGDSGAAGGRNQDDARFALFRDRVYAKWASARDALIDRVGTLLQSAASRAEHGDNVGAEADVRAALAASPNDPYALNMLAMVQRSSGRIAEARATQEIAVAVRPQDPSFVHNLALLALAQHESEFAPRCCERALALQPGYPERLRRELMPAVDA